MTRKTTIDATTTKTTLLPSNCPTFTLTEYPKPRCYSYFDLFSYHSASSRTFSLLFASLSFRFTFLIPLLYGLAKGREKNWEYVSFDARVCPRDRLRQSEVSISPFPGLFSGFNQQIYTVLFLTWGRLCICKRFPPGYGKNDQIIDFPGRVPG